MIPYFGTNVLTFVIIHLNFFEKQKIICTLHQNSDILLSESKKNTQRKIFLCVLKKYAILLNN